MFYFLSTALNFPVVLNSMNYVNNSTKIVSHKWASTLI